MSEKEESYVRSQVYLMVMRNLGKNKETKRVLTKFLKCVQGI
jgi:hypothetical protein